MDLQEEEDVAEVEEFPKSLRSKTLSTKIA